MPLRNELLPSFDVVAGGKTARTNIKSKRRVHAVWLMASDDGTMSTGSTLKLDTILAKFAGDIRIKLDGAQQRIHSLVQLNAANSINNPGGVPNNAQTNTYNIYGVQEIGSRAGSSFTLLIPIWFAEPWRKTPAEQSGPAWNLNQAEVENLQIEVDIASAEAGHAPLLSGFYEFEPLPTPDAKLGVITKFARTNLAASGTSNDFELDKKDLVSVLQLFATSDGQYVNKVQLKAGSTIIQDLITLQEQRAKLVGWGLSPDMGGGVNPSRFDLPLDYDDPVLRGLVAKGLESFNLHCEYNTSASGNLDVLIQRIGAPE